MQSHSLWKWGGDGWTVGEEDRLSRPLGKKLVGKTAVTTESCWLDRVWLQGPLTTNWKQVENVAPLARECWDILLCCPIRQSYNKAYSLLGVGSRWELKTMGNFCCLFVLRRNFKSTRLLAEQKFPANYCRLVNEKLLSSIIACKTEDRFI